MQTFETLAIGTVIFVPHVHHKDVETNCPDCMGGKAWKVETPAGRKFEITCPRCHGGERNWLLPRRTELALEIQAAAISSIDLRSGEGYNDPTVTTRVTYSTSPHIGSINAEDAFLTRADAEAEGARMLAEGTAKYDKRYLEELAKIEARTGQDIITALEVIANAKNDKWEDCIEKLKHEMSEAISWPTLYGPKLTRPTSSYSSPEITKQAMADWCSKVLDEAGIEGWSESELHELSCHC